MKITSTISLWSLSFRESSGAKDLRFFYKSNSIYPDCNVNERCALPQSNDMSGHGSMFLFSKQGNERVAYGE